MTSLDELLSHGDEAGAERTAASRLVRHGLAAGFGGALLAAGLVLALRLVGYELAYPLAAGGFVALIVLYQAVRAVAVTRPGRLGGRPESPDDDSGPDGLALAAGRWHTRLSGSRPGPGPRPRSAAPVVAELVDERLRRRHGITRDTDPARARALLGERLWAYLADPTARTPSPRDLAAMLTTVEKL